jgi:hypothetical protein
LRDSVTFGTNHIQFATESGELSSFAVDSILIADAVVFPNQGEVLYDAKGVMHALKSAKVGIVAHTLKDATVEIASKWEYKATGTVNYCLTDRNFIPIAMAIHTEKGKSLGVGIITNKQQFHLSPKILFEGNAYLRAGIPALRFEGKAAFETRDPRLNELEIAVNVQATADSIYIPLGKDVPYLNGLFLHEGSGKLFPAFMRNSVVGERLHVAAEGYLTERAGLLQIGSLNDLKTKLGKGIVSLDDTQQMVTFEGKCSLPGPNDWQSAVKIDAIGVWRQTADKTTADLRLEIGIPEVTHSTWATLVRYIRENRAESLELSGLEVKTNPRMIVLDHVGMYWDVNSHIVFGSVDLIGIDAEGISQKAFMMLKYADRNQDRGGPQLMLRLDVGWDSGRGGAAATMFIKMDKIGQFFYCDHYPFMDGLPTKKSAFKRFVDPEMELVTFDSTFRQHYRQER